MTDRKPATQWQVRKFADVGASEEFVRQCMELHQILNATVIVQQEEREQVNEALGTIQMEGLLPAFLELRKIRESVGKELPILDRLQLYEDFARKVWKAYKELMQQAAKKMGFEIGFLFQPEAKFESGLKKFLESTPALPDGFEEFLEDTRTRWQNELADFRNNIVEHPGADQKAYEKYYQPGTAEAIFDAVWRTIVQILAILLSLRLPEGVILIDEGSNDPSRPLPNRFRYELTGRNLP